MSSNRSNLVAPLLLAALSGLVATNAYAGDASGTGGGTGGGSGASGGTVVLNTSTTLAYDVPDGKVSKLTGSGVVDTFAETDRAGNILTTFTKSVAQPNNNGSRIQGAFMLHQLTDQGLKMVKDVTDLPVLDGDRTWMRPITAAFSGGWILVGASEDNGVNNGNPQAVAYIVDKSGNMVNITNNNRQGEGADKPFNLITATGQNDAQQYGPHSIVNLGDNSFVITLQRNNQNAYAMRVDVTMTGNGAQINVPWFNKIVNNAQHCRPQIARKPDGYAANATSMTVVSVDANTQPANVGVRALTINPQTGKVINSKVIAPSTPNQTKYAVQPTIAYISDDVTAIGYAMSSKNRRGNNGNAHSGGENLSYLVSIKNSDLSVADTMQAYSPYQRHSSVFSANYGPNNEPAAAAIGGSSTGGGKGLLRMIKIDPSTGKMAAPGVNDNYEVSKFSDVAQLSVRGKRNPNDQGRGFINGIGGLANPGYGKATGFMPEVKTFNLSAVAGYKADPSTNPIMRESLYLSLVPASWNPAVQTQPGSAQSNIPTGPSPTVPGSSTTSGGSSSNTGDGTGTSDGTDPWGAHASADDSSGGCSVGTTSTSYGNLSVFAGLGLAFMVSRRRRRA